MSLISRESLGKFMSRHRKKLLILFDIFAVSISYILPWVLISGRVNMEAYMPQLFSSAFLFVCCVLLVYALAGMYDSLWRYAEIVEFFRLVNASVVAVALFVVSSLVLYEDRRVPISVYALSAIFCIAVSLSSRLTYRMLRNTKIQRMGGRHRSRVMLIGAGEAAATILHEQSRNTETEMAIICLVDDSPEKVGRRLMGVEILGTTEEIPELARQCEIDTILLAIPTLDEADRRRILRLCAKTNCNLRILPDIRQMITDGGDLSSRIRDVKVEDLLGRDTVELSDLSAGLLEGKIILVTGAGGYIGSELCRQIARYNVKRLVMVDIYENNIYSIQQALLREYGDSLDMRCFIASVRDSKKMNALFAREQPQVVFHAAAHKHVPLMEDSPEEAVKNNVFGTYNTAMAADRCGCEAFVLVSTDKAVNPTNVMGASKRVCEMVIQAMGGKSKTSFVAVRFGNVLGSNGSVLPLFKEQIAAGGPLTVTHPDIVRYFMTVAEAVSLVLEAGAMGKGGEIFVLDMGKPVKILDLAENLIKLAGFTPYRDIDIRFIGLRPGEKLFEELLMDEEGIHQTDNAKIYVGAPIAFNHATFFDHIKSLKEIAYSNNSENLVQALIDLVPTFRHEPVWEITEQ